MRRSKWRCKPSFEEYESAREFRRKRWHLYLTPVTFHSTKFIALPPSNVTLPTFVFAIFFIVITFFAEREIDDSPLDLRACLILFYGKK